MQKLKPEQAEWLKEKIHATGWIVGNSSGQKVLEIINQCTEKEFPEFETKMSDNNDEADVVNVSRLKDGAIYMSGCSGDFNFTPEQFKQFTEGCNRICQWLEEQE